MSQGIRNALFRIIRQRCKHVNRIIVAGHSLGAGLSVLSSYDVHWYLKEELKLKPEEMPEVGFITYVVLMGMLHGGITETVLQLSIHLRHFH